MAMGGKGGGKMRVVDYHLSVQMGVCYGPIDKLLGVRINEKDAWTGNFTSSGTAITVANRSLFGGPKKEGGIEGRIWPFFGAADQVLPDQIAARWGETGATSPAYRGKFTVMFTGPVAPQHPLLDGFMWSTNNPMVAQTVWFKVQDIPRALNDYVTGDDYSEIVTSAGVQANAGYMIFETLTNRLWGMSGEPALIDAQTFHDCAAVLHSEGLGLSMRWEKGTVENYLQEICNHVQAMVFLHPRTGLLTMKLIRDDYDVETLRVINVTNAKLKNFGRKFLGETVTQITLTFTNPDTEEDETVTYHNPGAADQQGTNVPDTRMMYGIRDRALALEVCQRECWAASAPLASATVEMDRNGWDMVPGEVVKLDWPEKSAEVLIMRVGKIGYGKTGSRKINTQLYQDIFSLSRPPLQAGQEGEHVTEAAEPEPMDNQFVWTAPYFLTNSPLYNTQIRVLGYPEVIAGLLADSQQADATGYELMAESLDAIGDSPLTNAGTKSLVGRCAAPDALVQEAQSTYTMTLPVRTEYGPEIGGFVMFGNGGDTDSEIAQVVGTSGSNWVFSRGVLDTLPRAWAAGTPMWFFSPGRAILDQGTVRMEGEEPVYRFLTSTSLGTLDVDDASDVSATLTGRPHYPIRPANVKVNGNLWGSVALSGGQDITITWSNRNRLLEDVQVLSYTAAGVPPEYRQRTIITVVDPDNADLLLRQYVHLWTEETFVIDRDWYAKYDKVKIIVSSERDGLSSIQARSFIVTGLDDNGAAADPPAAPPEGVPPPPVPAPGPGTWTATGGTEVSPSGASNPIILVQGSPDQDDVRSLVVRYKVSGATDWNVWPAVDLNDPNQS